MAINEKGQFLKGNTPHNKREFISCRIVGCNSLNHKAYGYCKKHYAVRKDRIRKCQPYDDISLQTRLPRTEDHIKNNLAYIRVPGFVSPLKGKTYEDIHGVLANEKKQKISKRFKGVPTGRACPWKGKHLSEATKKKISISQIGKYSGSKNYFWRDGKSRELYGLGFSIKLKEDVRNRDGRKCVECGAPEIELEYALSVHHIDCNKHNNKIDNLVSLCRKCHSKIHWSDNDWRKHLRSSIKENEDAFALCVTK
jgi:hypothetical protein